MVATGISQWNISIFGLCFSLHLLSFVAHAEHVDSRIRPLKQSQTLIRSQDLKNSNPDVSSNKDNLVTLDASDSTLYRELVQETDPEKLKGLLEQAPSEELEALQAQLEAQENLSPVQEQVLQSIKDKKQTEVSSNLDEKNGSIKLYQISSLGKIFVSFSGGEGEVAKKLLAKDSIYYMTSPNGRDFPAFRDAKNPGLAVAPAFKPDGSVDTSKVQVLNISTQRSVTKPSSELGYQVDQKGQIHSIKDFR